MRLLLCFLALFPLLGASLASGQSQRFFHLEDNSLFSLEDAQLLNLEEHPRFKTTGLKKREVLQPQEQQESGQSSLVKRGTVHHGLKLNFHENAFNGSLRSVTWNQADPSKILILVGNTPYISEDTGKTFVDLSNLQDFSVVHGAHYGSNSGGFGVRTVLTSPVDPNYLILLGRGTNLWKSINGGKTFQLVNLKIGTENLYLRRVILHPTQKNLLFATHIDSHCLDGSIDPNDPICSNEAYISKDFGSTWTLVATHAWSYYWGAYKSSSGVLKDSLYLLVSQDKDSHQFGDNSGSDTSDLIEVVTDSNKVVNLRTNVYDMLSIGEYIYIIAPPPGTNAFSRLYGSHSGNPFKETSFAGGELRGFAFIDVSEGSVLVIDTPSEVSQTYADFRGDLWTSDSTGTYFTRSLQRVVLQSDLFSTQFDIHKIESLEGTYIATSLDSQGKLRSKISWNRGGAWQDIHSQAGIDGLVDEGENPFVLFGEIHSYNAGSHLGYYSEQSAPGSVLAIGSYSVPFVEYINGDSEGDVYHSRNGGKIFTKILDKLHFCRYLDEGSIIICVPGYAETTTSFLYSLDQGNTWVTETFSSEPGTILSLTSDPDSFGLVAVILVYSDNLIRLISVDLTELGLPHCTESDFERWMPSDSQDERHCILGHHSIYLRPKAEAACESRLNTFLVEKHDCPCGPADFECDVGYFYNLTSASCAPEKGTPVQPINCVNGFYPADLHYRLVPGNTCNKTLEGAIDLEADVETECPVEHLIADNKFKHKLAIALGLGVTFLLLAIIAAIAFVIWSKRKGYLQYRVLRTEEGGAGNAEIDMPDQPDHPDDPQE